MSNLVYPRLPARADLGIIRVGGSGIGNSLYVYFHALIYARNIGAKIIRPAWPSLRFGPMLRGEISDRFYMDMFASHDSEIDGLSKYSALAANWRGRQVVDLCLNKAPPPEAHLIVVRGAPFTFDNLRDERTFVRQRMREISDSSWNALEDWGGGDYIGVHVRMGDFAAAASDEVIQSERSNVRIPLAWYRTVLLQLREAHPDKPIRIFSDGREAELGAVLSIPGAALHRTASDLEDLIGLSRSSLLVGSKSTFSYWAAYLGNMPSIWLKTDRSPVHAANDFPRFVNINGQL